MLLCLRIVRVYTCLFKYVYKFLDKLLNSNIDCKGFEEKQCEGEGQKFPHFVAFPTKI